MRNTTGPLWRVSVCRESAHRSVDIRAGSARVAISHALADPYLSRLLKPFRCTDQVAVHVYKLDTGPKKVVAP